LPVRSHRWRDAHLLSWSDDVEYLMPALLSRHYPTPCSSKVAAPQSNINFLCEGRGSMGISESSFHFSTPTSLSIPRLRVRAWVTNADWATTLSSHLMPHCLPCPSSHSVLKNLEQFRKINMLVCTACTICGFHSRATSTGQNCAIVPLLHGIIRISCSRFATPL